MRREDFIAGIIFMIISITFFVTTFTFPKTPVQSTGPAFWPRLLSIMLFILSVSLIINSFRSKILSTIANIDLEETKKRRKALIRPITGIVISMLYVFLFKKVGFAVTTLLYFTSISMLVRKDSSFKDIKAMIPVLIQSSILVGIVYSIFRVFLKVNLPHGLLF
ncbi:MAG: tripartite tricarboxylate transporter TctB family protein [Firmicutes bacterium]|nr:tripartite tricarboxylate transporter TctB family protein [Bacillota bacterium]